MEYKNINDIKINDYNFDVPKDIHPLERRIVLQNYQVIDPFKIEEYIARGGYKGLQIAIEQESDYVIKEVMESNLRGRGGVGFPTGFKWSLTRGNKSEQKYVICNADEGEPGTFMDKYILEGDPHSVIEGMIIAGIGIGASMGYIYIRAEYPKAIAILEKAIKDAHEYHILGNHILGSSYSFVIEIRKGAGAFICGEETALLESIEGNRGEPRNKPPYPALKGLFAEPTIVNNVETLSVVPQIITKGGKWFKGIGTKESSGTKVLSISGKVKNPGIYEVDMGITLKEIIEELAGGMKEGSTYQYVAIGGPSGGFLLKEHLDVPIDFDSLVEYGAILGSGGIIVMDQNDCIIDILKVFMKFNQDESCGKCTPCREGTHVMTNLLDKLSNGTISDSEYNKLFTLGKTMQRASLCGLGQAAPNPIFSAIRYFEDEFIAHKNGVCSKHVCIKGGK
jgi:NADH-quinone oxidoreductase subunit F